MQVDPAEEFCGEDVVSLNGLPLDSVWDETQAEGSKDIDFYDHWTQGYATWQITCLAGGIDASDVNGVQVLSLRIDTPHGDSGFTVSYQAFPTPRIFQFDANPTGSDNILKNGVFWRTPSELTRDVSVALSKGVGKKTSTSAKSRQKSISFHALGDLIGAKVEAVKNVAKNALKQCRHHFPGLHSLFNKLAHDISTFFCPPQHRTSHGSTHALQDYITGNPRTNDGASPIYDESLNNHENSTSLATHDTSVDSSHTTGLPYDLEATDTDLKEPIHVDHQVRTLGLTVVLIALFVWVYKWLRDPRRRADRAARREERCRRHLYRRAARIQKLRNFFSAFRRRYHPAAHAVRNWDEKQALVLQQEEVLETVMKDEIRALCRAYREENNVVAAEEGRNHYMHEIDNRSERRRSMTTLPGYESEATQPPGYESDAVSVSDRFSLYAPVDSEDTPDSSVISTSPRISRDGRDSDFEKEVLGDWTLESGHPFGSRSVDM